MDYFSYKDGMYYAEGVSLEAIAKEVGTPFYCYSSATFEHHYKIFSEHFSKLDAKVCYAVKTNSNLAVLKTLAALGAGADVVSEGEIRLALAAGIKPQDIVFSGVGKTAKEMAYGLSKDIFQFNVESEPELELLNDVAAKAGKKAHIAIRVNPDVDAKTHAKISTGQKESKFGIAMGHALPVYKLAVSLSNIDVQGVSVHIGSQLTNIEPFAEAFARVREFVLMLRGEGVPIATIDLGGGLGIPYGEGDPPVPDSYADVVKQAVADLGCKLIFEPGRLISGNAGILVGRVLYVKKSEHKAFVIMDAAMNDLIRPTLYEAYHEIIPAKKTDAVPQIIDIVGPVCETGDIFAEDRLLPLPAAGDLLVLRTAGAYGAVMANTYNARRLVPEVMVKDNEWAVVRARQSYDDLIGRDSLPDWL